PSSKSDYYDLFFYSALSPKDLLTPVLYHGYYIRPRINKQLERGFSQVESEDDWYRVLLDVCQFTPDEISVRTVDNLLEVTGRHAQRMDQHGFVSREFTRTYILPMGVDPLHFSMVSDSLVFALGLVSDLVNAKCSRWSRPSPAICFFFLLQNKTTFACRA
uniref:Heat shock protein, alpha-crystallin-related, b2 n=1 Tax=Sinocyclocheilus grahami TaxID=75366 RepID=A0A672LKV7_SINGR